MKKKELKIDYATWPRKRVRVADLFLDSNNIRLQVESKSSPEVLINDLFLNEDAMQILESIARNGFFPDELPVVLQEDGKCVVAEGNRRIAALKVLSHPEIVPSKATHVRKLIKDTGISIKEIEVIEAPNRESVKHFLASKHTQDTRRPWKPLRQAYFYKAELATGKTVQELRDEYPTVDINRFLRLINVHKVARAIEYGSERVAKKVYNERTFPASTIERLYDDKKVREFLGFDFDGNGDLVVKIEKKEFEKGFRRVVSDVVDKVVDSRSLNNDANRAKYLAGFSEGDKPKKNKAAKTLTSKDFKEISPDFGGKRTKLAPKNILFTLKAPGVHRMLVELQGINYHVFPNAAHDLLRSFLECGLKAYFDDIGKPLKTAGKPYIFLNDALCTFKKEMDSIGNTELSQVAQRVISDNTMQPFSAKFLNATNHNPSVFATDKNVEEAWDALEKLFRFILNPVKENNAAN